MNAPCERTLHTLSGRAWCDLSRGHDGPHVAKIVSRNARGELLEVVRMEWWDRR